MPIFAAEIRNKHKINTKLRKKKMLTAKEILSQTICCYTLVMSYCVCNKPQTTGKEVKLYSYQNPILPNNYMLSPVPPF